MSEISPTSPAEPGTGTRTRNLIIIASAVALCSFFALFGWAVLRSGGTPGGFGINSKFGEVSVDQRLAPEFIEESLDGETLSLSQLRGKVVMLDFWSSWCPPCRKEAPLLSQVYREYENREIEFIGVAVWDDGRKVARHIQEFGLPYPNLLDERGRIAINYGVAGLPEKFFIDPHGNLVRKFVGPTEPRTLRAVLNELLELGGKSPTVGE